MHNNTQQFSNPEKSNIIIIKLIKKKLKEIMKLLNQLSDSGTKPSRNPCGSSGSKGPKPPRITLNDLAIKLNDVMLEIKSIHARLDEHDKMFKAHGWIK